MEIVVFIKKKKVEDFVEPPVPNTVLHTTRPLKYVGVILDAKLTWREHMKQRMGKAYSFF
jgi:hypothetical protein